MRADLPVVRRRAALAVWLVAACATGASDGGTGAATLGNSTSGDGSGDDGGPGPGTDPTIPDPDSGDGGPGGSDDAGETTGVPPDCVPVDEICDGVDNDCDGTTDEDDGNLAMPCDTGMLGPCMTGTTACEGGVEVCTPDTPASVETCDGVDNDCNGTIDDGDPGGGVACDTGMLGICSLGTSSCEGGVLACNADNVPQTEVCNASDDDCDGTPDDGNPGGGAGCTTGAQGICAAGTQTCVAGAVQCVQNQNSMAEVCGNALDDDCDGTVDDGCSCPLGLCDIGVGQPMIAGCDPCVDQVCMADGFCCQTNWDSICVGQVATVCGQAECVSSSCAHLVCVEGIALTSGCHPCVTSICAADGFCCSNSWDGLCVQAVATVCNLTCP